MASVGTLLNGYIMPYTFARGRFSRFPSFSFSLLACPVLATSKCSANPVHRFVMTEAHLILGLADLLGYHHFGLWQLRVVEPKISKTKPSKVIKCFMHQPV